MKIHLKVLEFDFGKDTGMLNIIFCIMLRSWCHIWAGLCPTSLCNSKICFYMSLFCMKHPSGQDRTGQDRTGHNNIVLHVHCCLWLCFLNYAHIPHICQLSLNREGEREEWTQSHRQKRSPSPQIITLSDGPFNFIAAEEKGLHYTFIRLSA